MTSLESRVLDLVGDVHGLLELDEFRSGLIGALARAVECDWVSINEFGPGPEDVWTLVEPPIEDEVMAIFPRYAGQNPLLRHQTGNQMGAARRLCDVIGRAEFHRLELYTEVYAPIGLEHQMAFSLPHAPPRHLGVALNRREREFSVGERELVNRARPFLIQGYSNAIAYEAGRAGVDGLRPALTAAGLSPRQADAVRLVALGRSNADIAAELGISVRTVHKHLQLAFAALDVEGRSQAAIRAWEAVGGVEGDLRPG